MKKERVPYLCGGTFFTLLTNAKANWKSKKVCRDNAEPSGNSYSDMIKDLIKDAWIVIYIFEHYAAGDGIPQIQEDLLEQGHETTRASIGRILRNAAYVGDRLLQKQPPKNYLTHKPDWLQAYESHYIKNTHEGIVSRELWDAVQRRIGDADELASMGTKVRRDCHFLYGKVFCGACGQPMKRKMVNACRPREDGTVDKIAVWKCADRLKGSKGNGCKNDIVKEDELLEIVCCELGIEVDELATAVDRIDRIVITGGQVEVFTFAVKEA